MFLNILKNVYLLFHYPQSMMFRYECIVRRCEELGLLERCRRIPTRKATLEELKTCHDETLVSLLTSTQEMDVGTLKKVSSQFDCLYIHPNSWEAALLASGAVVDLVKAV